MFLPKDLYNKLGRIFFLLFIDVIDMINNLELIIQI